MFVEVVVFSPAKATASGTIEQAFTYHLPDKLQGLVSEGSLVIVPFGPRRQYGIAVALSDRSPVPETRPVKSLVDPDPVLTPTQIALARWMSRAYLTPLHECLALMLSPGMVGYADIQVALSADNSHPPPHSDARPPHSDARAPHPDDVRPWDTRTEAQEQLVTVLDDKGPLRGRQLDRLLPRQQWRRAASQLARRRIVTKSSILAPPRARPKQQESEAAPGINSSRQMPRHQADHQSLCARQPQTVNGCSFNAKPSEYIVVRGKQIYRVIVLSDSKARQRIVG